MEKTNKVDVEILNYLKDLAKNNERDWFIENKKRFKEQQAKTHLVYNEIKDLINEHDSLETYKFFRIYKDVRFSKDKTPYKTHFGAHYIRMGAALRGGYYVHIEPGNNSFLGLGFWAPSKEDLQRIRQEIDIDAQELKRVIQHKDFVSVWGEFQGETLKTAPRGFDKEHPEVELLRRKNFVFMKKYSDSEVLSENFTQSVSDSFKAARPFLDVMSDILTTDLNGVSIL